MKTSTYWDSDSAHNATGAAVLLIVGALCVYLSWQESRIWDARMLGISLLASGVLLVFLLFLSDWADSRPGRLQALLWLEAALIAPLYWLIEVSFVAILGIVWIVQATELYPIRFASWLLGGAVLVFAGFQFYHFHPAETFIALASSVTLGMFHLFAVINTHRTRREILLRQETAALNRELIATRELLTQTSRQRERLRIARDLHDILGHHMTALILNLEVASHCSDDKAMQKVEQSLALGRLLLSDLRSAVSELREDDTIDLRQSVEKLIADIPDLEISMDFSAAPAIHEVAIAETLLRCIQEAITNILRHSKASRCRIALSEAQNEFFLTVKDNGHSALPAIPGNGLRGMQERAREAGGEVDWEQQQDGFLLQLRLPVGAGA